jgi:Protein of unknown function (DUF4238)
LSRAQAILTPEMSKYPDVKNAHIVPRTYLKNWAIEGAIGVAQVREAKRLEMPVEKVGTRRRFYRRQRPDGSNIDDVEATLAEIEDRATPLLRSFDEKWPLVGDDKLTFAVLIAFQHLRTPRWKDEYERRTRGFLDEYDREHPTDLSPEELEEHNIELTGSTHRLIQMLSTATTATGVVASMHWTLIEFQRPLLATSDHPVVLWPGVASRSPQATEVTQIGVIECVEIRLPLSPTRALLMTWSDLPDDEPLRVRGTRDHAANLNAFTVASAERQWFYHPGSTPPLAKGNLRPLALELVPGYTPLAAANSRRRAQTSAIANRKIGRDLGDREITVVTMSRGAKARLLD